MRVLFLHVGMPKAGSTSIQQSFDRHRAELAARGIRYLDLGPSHSKVFLALFSTKKLKLKDAVARHMGAEGRIEDYGRAELEAVLAGQLAGDAPVVVASGEMMFRFSRAQCRDLEAFLRPYFDEIRIVIYVREPLGLAASRAQQNVKGGRETLAAMSDPGAIRTGTAALVPQYRRHIETWIEVFGRGAVDIREFDRAAFVGGDLVVDFCHAVGVPEDLHAALAGVWTKTAKNAEAIELLDRYLERTPPDRRAAFAPLRGLVEDVPGSPFRLPPPTLEAVREASRADVEWLRATAGRPLFAERPIPAEREWPAWPEDTRAALARIVDGDVPEIGTLAGAERTAALDDLLDRLLARVAGRKSKAKYSRGRVAALAVAARDAVGFAAHRLGRALRRLVGGRERPRKP